MENQRTFLFLGLMLVAMLMWQAWEQDYGQPQAVASSAGTEAVSGQADTQVAVEDLPDVPAQETQHVVDAGTTEKQVSASSAIVRVHTDVYELQIDSKGGVVLEAKLLQYPVDLDHPDEPFILLKDEEPHYFVAKSGLIAADKQASPDHSAQFQVAQNEYVMPDDEDTLVVPLTWSNGKGVQVTRNYIFTRGKHSIEVQHEIHNNSDKTWTAREYRQLQRSRVEKEGMIYTYTGGVIHGDTEKYRKIDFDDMEDEKLNLTMTGGWAAMIQHYFLGAWVPPQDSKNQFYTSVQQAPEATLYTLGTISTAVINVQPSETETVSSTLFVGPKLQSELEELSDGLELTVDYGILDIISRPLFWLLDMIHGWVGNWGWAIIILTMLIKLLFYKLSETSYRSMAHMRKLTPKLQSLKERYGDDRQKLNQAMMEMYRKEKINPLGGCLPILVQIPVFIALYWALLESVELRQAPFILWIEDLSRMDPYFVLPVIMGISMFIQQKLNPAPVDPMQQKIMQLLPIIFTVFFAFFPSGLVLYWVVNNVLSIIQQWVITKRIEAA